MWTVTLEKIIDIFKQAMNKVKETGVAIVIEKLIENAIDISIPFFENSYYGCLQNNENDCLSICRAVYRKDEN